MQKLVGLDRRLSERSVQIRRFQNMESVLHGLPSAEGLFVASIGTDVVGDRSRPVTENQPAACKTPPPREEESRFGSLTPCVPCTSAPVLMLFRVKETLTDMFNLLQPVWIKSYTRSRVESGVRGS